MDTGGEVKRTFQLPALDPAVEIICRAWRSNTPSTTGPDTAREARNRRIKKVRLDTLCKTRRSHLCVCASGRRVFYLNLCVENCSRN